MADFPFIVAFAYTRDETNHFADILLPDATDLESLQLIRIGGTKFVEQFWDHQGWALRQPAVEPRGDTRDMTDIATELAGAAGSCSRTSRRSTAAPPAMPLKGDALRLCARRRDARRRATTSGTPSARRRAHELTDGDEVHDLAWFKEHGFMTAPLSAARLVPLPDAGRAGAALRAALPGAADAPRRGARAPAARERHRWWDKQLDEYELLPA